MYDSTKLVAKLDTSIALTHVIVFRDTTYLVSEAEPTALYFDLHGKEVGIVSGQLFYGRGDTVLYVQHQRHQNALGQREDYFIMKGLGQAENIDQIHCYGFTAEPPGGMLYVQFLDSTAALYNMDLTRLADAPAEHEPPHLTCIQPE